MRSSAKKRNASRKRYFYWKYRKAHPEKFEKKAFKKRAKTMERMGASKGTAGFLAGLTGSGRKYRIRYGYIDENDLGSFKNSKVTIPVGDMQMALDQYRGLKWLKTYEKGKRRFVRIEVSSDGGKTWPTGMFHDCQHHEG